MGGMLSTAHDMDREWRFISGLAVTEVPVAPPLAFCADTDVTGAEFYVMGFVDGLVLADRVAVVSLTRAARVRAGEHLVEVLVALHALDIRGRAGRDGALHRVRRAAAAALAPSGAPVGRRRPDSARRGARPARAHVPA
jgi:aminoglycoside phosphotransferase (APT) family kinase protein